LVFSGCLVLTCYTVSHRVLHHLLNEAESLLDHGEVKFLHEDKWRQFTRVHQALLLNVFGVQNKLRITTLGVRHWTRISRRRINIRPGYTVRLSDLMVLVRPTLSTLIQHLSTSYIRMSPCFVTAFAPQDVHVDQRQRDPGHAGQLHDAHRA
jgi:hypothetical protein